MFQKFVPFALLAVLASCTAITPDPYLTTQALSPDTPPVVSDISADFAAAYLPTLAGGIHSVRQTVASNSLHQEIVYANQTTSVGENVLTVNVGPPETAQFLRPPSLRQVRNEMRLALPGLVLSVSPTIGDNASGAYGYATVSVGGGACIYAWQYVRQVTPADSIGLEKLTRRRLAANVRLRYCHPSIPASRIHVLMDGLRVKDINSQTIDMLRFAADTADVARPQAVVAPEPLVISRKVVRQAAAMADDDWRQPTGKRVTRDATPRVIDNAAIVPLPDASKDQPQTTPVSEETTTADRSIIPDAALIPIPE